MLIGNFHNGQSLSKSEQDKLFTMKNVEVFADLGNAQCQYALVSDSTTPNEDCILVTVPSGDVYHFSTESGKTWKQTGGVYSLANTNSNGAHNGVHYYNGRLFYSAGTKLGYFDMSSTWTDSWQTFTQSATWRPMKELNNQLFIGNGRFVSAIVSSFTFQDEALDLPSTQTVSALSSSGIFLIIGTTGVECKSYLWDKYSTSWTDEDMIPEEGVNFFIEVDNGTFAQCGTSGNIYEVSGAKFTLYTNIRETTSWNPYVSSVLKSKTIFGVNEKIFTFNRKTAAFSYGLVNEYTLTNGSVKGLTVSNGQLYISTGNNIDKIGSSFATAVIETPETIGSFVGTRVLYDTLGGTIGIETSVNGNSYVERITITDLNHNIIRHDGKLTNVNFYRSRITMTPTTGNVSIKYIENVSYNDQNI